MSNEGSRWELEQDLGLYKFYLDLVLKAAVFLFAITGGISSYYLANRDAEPLLAYSLFLPIVVNAGFSLICGLSAGDAQVMRDRHYQLCEKEGVRLAWEMRPLPMLLRLFAVVYGVIAVALIVLMVLGLCGGAAAGGAT